MIWRVVGGLCLGLFSISGLAADWPHAVPVGIGKAYVPVGFDDNDVSQVVIAGELPSTCYRVGPYEAKVDTTRKVILIRQGAYIYQGFCLPILIPFAQVIPLGVIPAGTYSVLESGTGRPLGTLPVERSQAPSPDDFLYAPVNDAYIQSQENPKSHTLVLNGVFADHCSSMKEVRVQYQKEVIVVQPIMGRTPGSERGCPPGPTRFTHKVPLVSSLGGDYLLHVRTLNGQAINKIVDLP